MHELQIATNIISIVEEEIRKAGKTEDIEFVHFIAGKMRAIIPESLQFSFDVLKRNKPFLASAELQISEIPIKIRCKNCKTEHTLDEPVFQCETCSSTEIEIISGDELYIDSIEFSDT